MNVGNSTFVRQNVQEIKARFEVNWARNEQLRGNVAFKSQSGTSVAPNT